MKFLIKCVLVIGVCTTLANCRPTHYQEEDDSEMGGVEYEGDESADDEYVPEEGEPTLDEASRNMNNHGSIIQASHNEESAQDADNKEDSEKFAETESNKEVDKNNPDGSSYRREGKSFSFVKEHPNYNMFGPKNAAEVENPQPSRNDNENNRVECRNVDDRSPHLDSDYSGDMLFKKINDQFQKDNNGYEVDENVQSNLKKQFGNNRPVEKKSANNYDYFSNSDRNRRQVQGIEEKPAPEIKSVQNENNNLDAANENTILKNIKKLSDQDLENLMNSLPEDKKALLRKIMDKREITKKDGAIEDNYLDQSDPSKIEGGYSASSLSCNSGSTETNKNVDNSEVSNTKVSDSDSDSGKLGSKSGEKGDTSTTEESLDNTDSALKNEGNINANTKETLKTDNKREINRKDLTNKRIPFDDSLVLDTKSSNDSPIEKEISEDEDWLEPKSEEFIAEQREESQSDPSDISASVEKLEESFPNANAYEDIDSGLEPLVRIKRKESHHRVKKRDLPFMTNDNLSFITDFASDGSDNDERCEFNHKEYGQSENGIEGEDHNVMNTKKIRNKRSLSSNVINSVINAVNLTRSSRTTGPLYNENNSMTDNRLDKTQYQIDEAFGSFTGSSEEDVNRYKRVKK